MKTPISRLARLGLASVVMAVAACGNGLPGNDATEIAQQSLGGLFNRDKPVDPRTVLTPQLVASSQTPLMLVVGEDSDLAFTMIPLATTGDLVQWRDAAGAGIFRRDGILVGTRGFGFELWSAEVDELRAALRSGGADDVVRVNRYLNGENQIVAVQYICTVTAEGRQTVNRIASSATTQQYREVCAGDGPAFENLYWVRGNGDIVRSLELVHPEYGRADITILVD